jgi:hypothetical protein
MVTTNTRRNYHIIIEKPVKTHRIEIQPNQIFIFFAKFIAASLMCEAELSNLFV